jgi:hypothetical protein
MIFSDITLIILPKNSFPLPLPPSLKMFWGLWPPKLKLGKLTIFRNSVGGPVAQLNRAFDYGSKGFRFES